MLLVAGTKWYSHFAQGLGKDPVALNNFLGTCYLPIRGNKHGRIHDYFPIRPTEQTIMLDEVEQHELSYNAFQNANSA